MRGYGHGPYFGEKDTTPSQRTAADYAIEHAEYLAQAVEAYMLARNAPDAADRAEIVAERFSGMRNAIYEFRKRAKAVLFSSEGSSNG